MRELFAHVECVLFDFDGPLCSLFAVHSAPSVARRLSALAADRGHRAPVSDDPHAVLRAVAGSPRDPGLARLLERALTQEEIRAAATAQPTPQAAELLRALAGRGLRLAVTTNNSPLAVATYLATQHLSDYFLDRIHGRRPGGISQLKPHPSCLLRALHGVGTSAERALMIGDTPTDLLAAQAAGTPFLGFAPDEPRAHALHAAGAPYVTTSLENVVRAASAPSYG